MVVMLGITHQRIPMVNFLVVGLRELEMAVYQQMVIVVLAALVE